MLLCRELQCLTCGFIDADAIIKCFATAVATGILLYVSPILFGTKLGFLVVPGTVVVFIASWLYMDNPPPKTPAPAAADGGRKGAAFSWLGDYMKVSLVVDGDMCLLC
jgi:hypothetical protein